MEPGRVMKMVLVMKEEQGAEYVSKHTKMIPNRPESEKEDATSTSYLFYKGFEILMTCHYPIRPSPD